MDIMYKIVSVLIASESNADFTSIALNPKDLKYVSREYDFKYCKKNKKKGKFHILGFTVLRSKDVETGSFILVDNNCLFSV